MLAIGAPTAEHDCAIALLGEAASLVKLEMIEPFKGVGFPALTELVEKVREFNTSPTSEVPARRRQPFGPL